MDSSRPYNRSHYRLAVTYPAMFSDSTAIGEGTVTNLSVFGCTISGVSTLPSRSSVAMRLILPDERDSLPIEAAEIRWTNGRQVGVQFQKIERSANLRLHNFVWDQMLERLRAVNRTRFVSGDRDQTDASR